MPKIDDSVSVIEAFNQFWDKEKDNALIAISEEEGVDTTGLKKLIDDYMYTQLDPLPNKIVDILHEKPKVLTRKKITNRVIKKIKGFVETFHDEMGGEVD